MKHKIKSLSALQHDITKLMRRYDTGGQITLISAETEPGAGFDITSFTVFPTWTNIAPSAKGVTLDFKNDDDLRRAGSFLLAVETYSDLASKNIASNVRDLEIRYGVKFDSLKHNQPPIYTIGEG